MDRVGLSWLVVLTVLLFPPLPPLLWGNWRVQPPSAESSRRAVPLPLCLRLRPSRSPHVQVQKQENPLRLEPTRSARWALRAREPRPRLLLRCREDSPSLLVSGLHAARYGHPQKVPFDAPDEVTRNNPWFPLPLLQGSPNPDSSCSARTTHPSPSWRLRTLEPTRGRMLLECLFPPFEL